MNVPYVVARLVRRMIPIPVTHFLMHHRILLKPGMEGNAPAAAVERYFSTLNARSISIEGLRVMIFGYGGNYGVGAEFLRRGARHVVLYDPYASLDDAANAALMATYGRYFDVEGDRVVPKAEFFTILGDIDRLEPGSIEPMDLVISTSVLEHVSDVHQVVRAVAKHTAPNGMHLHFVDLRDHHFKYPFEMLTFSESTWSRWLNPPSNLNRHRIHVYDAVFRENFSQVELEIVANDEANFQRVRDRIRPEFLTGDVGVDSATRLRVFARGPARQA